ncbi:hypothetical protein [Euzebya rosea]|uniref:hypothetical protein n=1 Tax=Euzebya rosea TaxID=2052804 RepID=UPI000D3E692E|nr:hypothetical protein [Euzebya rosea]
MIGGPGAIDAPPTPDELLMQGRLLASRGIGNLGSTASRGAALLGRAALEEALFGLYPELRQLSGRAMFLVLPNVFPKEPARRAAFAWGRLSAASHHHAYEMPPTAEELDLVLDTVHDVLEAVERVRERRRQRASATRAAGG